MKRTIKIDPFFDKQPPLSFIDELKKPLHSERPPYYGLRTIVDGEVDAGGMFISGSFPTESADNGILDTAYDDFNLFLDVYGISGDSFPLSFERDRSMGREEHKIAVHQSGVVITAGDTEGARRAIIYVEDELRRREAAFLPKGEIKRTPSIRSRITRCFFSPINRPPKYGDELSDDIDYYPDEYLNRLAHDGANGVWIYTRFSDIIPSSYIIENGKDYEKRIAKLNRVIDKCARYGIGVYVFAIEPVALTAEQAQRYPELAGSPIGANGSSGATFCVSSEQGREFCREAGERLATLAPGLAGYISITYGERTTSCASHYKSINCPRCAGKSLGEVLADDAEALRSGFRAVKPKCECISWTYGHRLWEFEDIEDYVRRAPDDVMLMQNFDDMGYAEQLGEMRQCVDYWLSYVGPSELFEITAQQAKKSGKHMFAKMQVCCSHEIASVPYIPAPGILYEKYAGARRLGVEGIMQCWYFGNYPSLMSKAAGELSFISEFNDEDGFLRHLAGIYWGNSKAEEVARAWREFEASYTEYPMNVMFSYYGPMHDGVVWELALKPKNFSLPRTWQTLDPTDGDRIGESLLNGHTLPEALTLLNTMNEHWNEGRKILSSLAVECEDEREQRSVADTVGVLFSSGYNILKFYLLRDKLGRRIGDAAATLEEMRAIVHSEIEHSREAISLCEADGRLGYHSEGEGYKFFPQKLNHRIDKLNELLDVEFSEVSARIEAGAAPLEYYEGIEDNDSIKRYKMNSCSLDNAAWEYLSDNNARFRIAYDENNLYIELKNDDGRHFTLYPEYNLLWPDATVSIDKNGKLRLGSNSLMYYSLFGERAEREIEKYRNVEVLSDNSTHLKLTLALKEIGVDKIRPMKLKISSGSATWCREENPVVTLGKSEVSPGDYGWLLP